MAKFFHFTSTKKLKKILNIDGREEKRREEKRRENKLSLIPSRRMVSLGIAGIPEKGYEGAIFGVLDKEAKAWWINDWDCDTSLMETVLKDIDTDNTDEIALLEVDTKDNNEDIYVADWGVHLDPEHDGSNCIKASEFKIKYVNSLIPINKYKSSNLHYKVPEVICFREIPVSDLSIEGKFNLYAFIDENRKKYRVPETSIPSSESDNIISHNL